MKFCILGHEVFIAELIRSLFLIVLLSPSQQVTYSYILRIPDDLQNLYIIMLLWYLRKPFHNNQGFVQLVPLRGESRSGH